MIRDTLNGLAAYGRAFHLINKARLWPYFIAPALISLALVAVIGGLAFTLKEEVGGLLFSWWPWDWGDAVVDEVGKWISALLMVLLGLILYKHLVMILSGPFMSPLSEKVENYVTGHTPNKPVGFVGNLKTMIRGLRIAVRLILREIFFTIPLLLLSFIPGLNLVTTALLFLLQAYYAGFGNLDFALERFFNVRESIRFVHRHRGVALGNGIPFILLLLTGFGFLIALPFSTVAGTLETLKKLQTAEENIL